MEHSRTGRGGQARGLLRARLNPAHSRHRQVGRCASKGVKGPEDGEGQVPVAPRGWQLSREEVDCIQDAS